MPRRREDSPPTSMILRANGARFSISLSVLLQDVGVLRDVSLQVVLLPRGVCWSFTAFLPPLVMMMAIRGCLTKARSSPGPPNHPAHATWRGAPTVAPRGHIIPNRRPIESAHYRRLANVDRVSKERTKRRVVPAAAKDSAQRPAQVVGAVRKVLSPTGGIMMVDED